MPELPEVETVRAGLEKILEANPRIEKIHLRRRDIRFPIPKSFASSLEGHKVTGVRRRAKYLLIDTSGPSLLSHLGMTGSWRLVKPSEPEDKHDHCVIEFSDGKRMVFRDPRRFGMLDLVEKGGEAVHPRLKALGLEPLDRAHFTGAWLFQKSRKRKVSIKVFIMDQKIVVGVGNIYASEALFRAGIRPTRLASRITLLEAERLVESIREVLNQAIEAGGSSIRDYRGADGSSGDFQSAHQVYDRGGEPCVKCETVIRNKVIGGRSTYWCPHCQK